MERTVRWLRGAVMLVALLGAMGLAYGKDRIVDIPEVRVDSVIYKVLTA